jgi:hypothetical protein
MRPERPSLMTMKTMNSWVLHQWETDLAEGAPFSLETQPRRFDGRYQIHQLDENLT